MNRFHTKRRIEFCDTDMAGIVHFSNFFRFMEAAETEFLRSIGISVSYDESGNRFGFPRVSVACDYSSPARFEDVLDIAVSVEKIGTKSLSYRFEFSRNGDPIATGRITSVFCREIPGVGLQSMDVPHSIRSRLEEFLHRG